MLLVSLLAIVALGWGWSVRLVRVLGDLSRVLKLWLSFREVMGNYILDSTSTSSYLLTYSGSEGFNRKLPQTPLRHGGSCN